MEQGEIVIYKTSDEFDFQIKTNLPPHEGVFYDGQIFDAHLFVSNLANLKKASYNKQND